MSGLPPRGTQIPARPLEPGADLDAYTAAWATARLTPTPFAPSLDPMPMPMPRPTAAVPSRYAFCSGTPRGYPSETTRARLDAEGAAYDLIDAGHDAPLTAPEAVASWLMEGTT